MTTIAHHDVVYATGEKKIHYLAAGPINGPLILFIHGWPATAITWKKQIDAFAALGFYAIAPDMPGYGKSTSRRVIEDYSQEAIVEGMMALLAATGRSAAIWVGHDWGAGVTSSIATQHPSAVKALVNICVPYRTIELGWEGFLPLVDRELYPIDEYELGQWDYMANYEEIFEKTVEWFEQDIAGLCKACMQLTTKAPSSLLSPFATIRKSGWFGGLAKPPSVDMLGPPMLAAEAFDSYVKDMETTGFWPGSAYYMNYARNAEYDRKTASANLGGIALQKPVLFIHAAWDTELATKTSRLVGPMREACENLTEVTVEAGHWVQHEKAGEANAALIRFIVEEVPSEWPGSWDSGYVKKRKSGL
ncbi:hypothetical protein G7Y89_g15404 [Cudoniella acicularis]|uniref:AB hydrolase-1 domain-containing protein n=1 Tax=Cudoniella acicularis TaxID=354080 RepID=A0A8H4QNZ7_9HELO|nr:hypothetical protein G7Y89_g15404 [Cudoniella acicularis]